MQAMHSHSLIPVYPTNNRLVVHKFWELGRHGGNILDRGA
jgi:hypothetical protein